MSQKFISSIAVVGIDTGKNSFHVVGHNQGGAIVLRQKWSRGQVEARMAIPAASNRHGGLRRGPSSQPQSADTRTRHLHDAGEVRASILQGTKERLP
jgi:hypothetical protein